MFKVNNKDIHDHVDNYLFRVNHKDTANNTYTCCSSIFICKFEHVLIHWKQRNWRRSEDFTVNFLRVLQAALASPLSTLEIFY